MTDEKALETLRVLLWLGAAMTDATADQREELRRQVVPAVEDGLGERVVRARVRAVMPRRWRPRPEWASSLAALQD